MSTWFCVWECEQCSHRVPVGFVGGEMLPVVWCSACEDQFRLGRCVDGRAPLWGVGRGEREVTSKRGRVKKRVATRIQVVVGAVPHREVLSERHGDVFIDEIPAWEASCCPSCAAIGALEPAGARCLRCGGAMQPTDL